MYRVHILAEFGNGAHQVGRTAGAGEPVRTGISVSGFQVCAVVELIASQVGSHQDGVIQVLLHHIRVLGVLMDQVHSLIPVGKSDGGADLAVRVIVGQLVGIAEVLTVGTHADTAGNIGLGIGHRIPDGVHGVQVRSPIRIVFRQQGGDVRYTSVEIAGAHGMSYRFRDFLNGGIVLRIFSSVVSAFSLVFFHTSAVNQGLGGIQILLSGSLALVLFHQLRQLHKTQLDLFMAVREPFSDYIQAVVRIADAFSVAGVSHHRLKEMAGVVHLMVGEISPPMCSR